MRLHNEPVSLDRLLQRCQSGDTDAWKSLVDATKDLVWSVAKRQGMSNEDGGDVFQDTYVALHGSLATIRSGQALPRWIAVAAARACHQVRRRNSRYSTVDPEPIMDATADLKPAADELVQQMTDAFLARKGLDVLGGKCKDLLSRLYFNEDDYQQISEELGIAMGSIGPTRARCLEKLKKILEKLGFGEINVLNSREASS
jgi:RNA polymerase sigma factor (sigma-70 family)